MASKDNNDLSNGEFLFKSKYKTDIRSDFFLCSFGWFIPQFSCFLLHHRQLGSRNDVSIKCSSEIGSRNSKMALYSSLLWTSSLQIVNLLIIYIMTEFPQTQCGSSGEVQTHRRNL